MGVLNRGLSAIGKLLVAAGLLGAFLFGMAGVVYMSLKGAEIQVPEITGKDFVESEKELAQLGLKIKRRADRFSSEQPNMVLEQLPKPGETVKTGQMILVVVSKSGGEPDEKPATLKKDEEEDTKKIEEMISDKPKKPSKPKADKKKTEKVEEAKDGDAEKKKDDDDKSVKKDGADDKKDVKKPADDKPKTQTDKSTPKTPSQPKAGNGEQRPRTARPNN